MDGWVITAYMGGCIMADGQTDGGSGSRMSREMELKVAETVRSPTVEICLRNGSAEPF